MCGRYILIQKAEVLEKRFGVRVHDTIQIVPSYNIAQGKFAPVITNDHPHEIQLFRFGLTPFWMTKPSLFINVRSEGDHNTDNDPNYSGAKGITTEPAFRKSIRTQRCLVPADAFIEGPEKEKLNKPFVVYLREKVRPFAFAGIWDTWKNPESGELIKSFAIITTVANELLQKIQCHHCPVILHRGDEKNWLSGSLPLSEVTRLLIPYPSELMNAYPIAPTIKNPGADDPGLIHPAGERLMSEKIIRSSLNVRIIGVGRGKDFGFDKYNPLEI
ncbi:MAG TPA: SOS response-associated peptidase [Prolixibacteraceae bacterium]|jgi:putative SOS response-associated peptidase YedK